MMDIDRNVSLVGLPDPAICNIIGYLDEKSLFDLSWSNSFWLHRLDNDEYWRQLLVNQLEGIDIETCNRRLDSDAPSQFAWMNADHNLDSFESVRERATRESILAITEANIGITLGMLQGDGDYDEGIHYDYRSARFDSRARKLNPKARYALTCHHKGESCTLYSILNQLFEVAKVDPIFLGGMVPMDAYLKASEWPGWPFNLQSRWRTLSEPYLE